MLAFCCFNKSKFTTGALFGFFLVNATIDGSGDAAASAAYYRVCGASALATKVVPVTVMLMAAASAHTLHHTGSLASKVNVAQLVGLALPVYILHALPLMVSSGAGDGASKGMQGANLLMLSFIVLNIVCMAIDSDEGHTSKKASKLLKIWQMWRIWKS